MFTSLTRFRSEPTPASCFCLFVVSLSLFRPRCLIERHCAQSSQALCLACCFLSPWGGEGTPKKKKRQKKYGGGGGLCTTRSLRPPPFRCPDACIKESTRCSPWSHTYYVASRCPCGLIPPPKKNWGGTTHESCNCYAASLSAMVEPGATSWRSSTCCSSWTEDCSEFVLVGFLRSFAQTRVSLHS